MRRPANNDIVECVCEDNREFGLMIMCEQCIRWFHGTPFPLPL